jgi:hypothetical protein
MQYKKKSTLHHQYVVAAILGQKNKAPLPHKCRTQPGPYLACAVPTAAPAPIFKVKHTPQKWSIRVGNGWISPSVKQGAHSRSCCIRYTIWEQNVTFLSVWLGGSSRARTGVWALGPPPFRGISRLVVVRRSFSLISTMGLSPLDHAYLCVFVCTSSCSMLGMRRKGITLVW